MPVTMPPREYPVWRTDTFDRAEDAAYTFGYHLILHCRDEAMAEVPAHASPETRAAVEAAVDLALHNVMDMLEGFWPLSSGPSHSVEYVLQVRVRDAARKAVECLDISPCKQDLPIGYWKWARDGEFK
jgi:hypothetical protein